MNKIFKYLSVAAIAGTLGFQGMNVNAATTCGDGEKLHTNYYLFLEVDPQADLARFVSESSTGRHSSNTQTRKFNNIKKGNIVGEGNIGIKVGSNYTVSAEINWTAAEFWEKYYNAMSNKNADFVYTKDDESYIMNHNNDWDAFEDDKFSTMLPDHKVNSKLGESLLQHIKDNKSNLANSALVKQGTTAPDTTIVAPNNLKTSSDDVITWGTNRRYNSSNVSAEGIELVGTDGAVKVLYAPAAYYVEYCVADDDATEKTIKYVENIDANVSNMPDTQKFKTSVKISDLEPTAKGYKFLGWSDTATGSAQSKYNPGKTYEGKSITLYAVWEDENGNPVTPDTDRKFTITYDANGGKDAPKAQTEKVGTCVKISKSYPTKSDNTFLGWSEDKNAKEPDKKFSPEDGEPYCGAEGDKTLYAVWSPKNPKTGIAGHLIAFGTVVIAASAALVIAKKKDLFRQI